MKRPRYTLTSAVPILLLLIGLMVIAGVGFYVYQDSRKVIAEDERAETLELATLVGGQLAYYLRRDSTHEANQLLDAIKVDRSIVESLVVDSEGRIIMAGSGRLLDLPLEETEYARYGNLIHQGLAADRPVSSTMGSLNDVLAAVPLLLATEEGELAPSRTGLFVLHRDVQFIIQKRLGVIDDLLFGVSALLLLALLGLWLGLRKLLLQRMRQLVEALDPQQQGLFEPPRALRGTDELSTIARAFQQFTNRLMQTVESERETVADLIRSERRYRSLFMDSPDAIFVNRGGRIVMVNRACVTLFGAQSENDLLDRPALDLFHSDFHALIVGRIHRVRDLGEVVGPAREKIVRLDGEIVDVEVNTSSFEHRGEQALHVILRDITQRVRQEREITLQSNFLQATLDSTGEGIVACDARGALTTFNRTARRWHLKDSESSALGQRSEHYSLMQPDGVTPLAGSDHPLARAYRGDLVRDMEMIIDPSAGRRRHVVVNGGPVIDSDGNRLGAVVSMQDITARKRAEEALRASYDELERRVGERTAELAAANARLRELDQLKSMFIASMSHELRTPLNSIIGFTGLLLMRTEGPLTETQEDYLRRVNGSGKLLLGLISDVIDVSKIEAGKVSAVIEPVEVGQAIGEAVETVQGEAWEKGLEIEISGDTGARVRTDRKRLMQCVLNFLSNAVKYTVRGRISVHVTEEEKWLRVAVTDTGIGIDEKEIGSLFRQFSRIETPDTRGIPGAGLGLYLTRNLVEQVLGGEVGVSSRPRHGSTFWLQIPRNLES